ncbi:hypothetical protein HK102_004915 [Quaeritorhiza haematococci]|nr:hypothetical protein HK102_004915 [Quaeritorhiza haematococci]
MANRHAGGTIYQWSLGSNASPCQAAAKFGHQDVIRLLLERSSVTERLIALSWLHDAAGVTEILAANPGLVVPTDDQAEIANAATRNDAEAVRLMLQAGLPVTARGRHGATPIHWAAFHGNVAMIQAILPFGPPLEDMENDYKSKPLGWAIHGSEQGWYSGSGDYAGAVEALLAAGATVPETTGGTELVKARRFGTRAWHRLGMVTPPPRASRRSRGVWESVGPRTAASLMGAEIGAHAAIYVKTDLGRPLTFVRPIGLSLSETRRVSTPCRGRSKRGRPRILRSGGVFVGDPGDDRLSRCCTIMGPSGLTAVFGMGTGVAPTVWSPERRPAGVFRPAGRDLGGSVDTDTVRGVVHSHFVSSITDLGPDRESHDLARLRVEAESLRPRFGPPCLTAPVKLPDEHGPVTGCVTVRADDHSGWYFTVGSPTAGAAGSKPPTYPTQNEHRTSANLQ